MKDGLTEVMQRGSISVKVQVPLNLYWKEIENNVSQISNVPEDCFLSTSRKLLN